MTKFSIVVPSFNYYGFLSECLLSIHTQSFTDFEVLIADGGSTDGSIELINDFVLRDSRFSLVSTSDNGQADALNKAFFYASGSIHCFLNADDVFISTDALARAAEAFKEFPHINLISFSGYFIDSSGIFLTRADLFHRFFNTMFAYKFRFASLQPSTFWRSSLTSQFPFDCTLNFVFDVDFFNRIILAEFSWLSLDNPIAGYRLHGNNKSVGVNIDRVREIRLLQLRFFGVNSYRVYYLSAIINLIRFLLYLPSFVGVPILKLLYSIINTLSYLTLFRLPAI